MPVNNALTPEGLNALGAAFGYYPQLKRQGQKARELALSRDVNTLPDPRTYAAVSGLLGEAPDEMGFSVLHPDYQGIRDVADPAYALGVAAGAAPVLAKPVTMATLEAARLARQAALAGGKSLGPTAASLAEGFLQKRGLLPGVLPAEGRSGIGAFDPRYDPRVNEQARMQSMVRNIELNPDARNAPTVSLADFEGRPFITTMADRTAAGGNLVGINDVNFNRPVELPGGQDYMFNNPGQVWAAGKGPANALMKRANLIKSETGVDPLHIPYRMAPTGGDFASMTGETMFAYADSAMNKTQKKSLDKSIKQFIPDWSGVSDPASVEQFRNASDVKRKAIKDMMDKKFRNEGGLNIGSARLAVSDPAQFDARQGGIMNVGEIYADQPIVLESGHPSYPRGIPGRGIGTVNQDTSIFELLPEYTKARGIVDPRLPSDADLRSISMKPYSGVITNELLKRLGY